MPNGGDKAWDRICFSIDGFRLRHGRWPRRVRVEPLMIVTIACHILTPIGFALVNSVVELVPDETSVVIAEDDEGAVFDYSVEGPPQRELEPSTRSWFGEAIVRPDVHWL